MKWKIYEAILKLLRYNQGMRGTFFHSAKHAVWLGNCNLGGIGQKAKKNICKLDDGNEVVYTEMSGKFIEKTSTTKFPDYVCLGRGKYLRNQGNW